MSLKSSLYTYLSTYAGLTALIGTRIYPAAEVPQGLKTYCAYSQLSNDRTYSHQGFSHLEDTDLQINCYAETTLSADAIAAQVTLAIEAWPAANADAQAAFVNTISDLYEPQTDLHFSAVEVSISHSFS
jgi:hypothetical protein